MSREARAGLALAVIVLGACSGPGPVEQACMPGETRECTCADGASGIENCALDGSQWRSCFCPMRDDGGVDTGNLDAGRHDAGQPAHDAGRDAGASDAGLPVCDLYARGLCNEDSQCGVGLTCRRSHLRSDPVNASTGPAECQMNGPLLEHHYDGTCSAGTDCACGLFCNATRECVRYCDPHGEPCPYFFGSPQRCVEDTSGIYYCART